MPVSSPRVRRAPQARSAVSLPRAQRPLIPAGGANRHQFAPAGGDSSQRRESCFNGEHKSRKQKQKRRTESVQKWPLALPFPLAIASPRAPLPPRSRPLPPRARPVLSPSPPFLRRSPAPDGRGGEGKGEEARHGPSISSSPVPPSRSPPVRGPPRPHAAHRAPRAARCAPHAAAPRACCAGINTEKLKVENYTLKTK